MNIRETLMDVEQVMSCLGRSRSYCYGVIRKLNRELEEKGYLVERGRVPASYLVSRYVPVDVKGMKI